MSDDQHRHRLLQPLSVGTLAGARPQRGQHLAAAGRAGRPAHAAGRRQRGRRGARGRDGADGGRADRQRPRQRCVRDRLGRQRAARPERLRPLARSLDARATSPSQRTMPPKRGWDAVTVPGAVSAWVALSRRFGKLPFDAACSSPRSTTRATASLSRRSSRGCGARARPAWRPARLRRRLHARRARAARRRAVPQRGRTRAAWRRSPPATARRSTAASSPSPWSRTPGPTAAR